MKKIIDDELYNYLLNYRENLREQRRIASTFKSNKQFKLSEDSIRCILDNQIIPKHKDVKYEIYKAKRSNSYYVKLMYSKTYVTARISDHESKFNVPGKVIDSPTLKKQIVRLLEDRVIALKTKYKYFMISKYKEGRKSCEA